MGREEKKRKQEGESYASCIWQHGFPFFLPKMHKGSCFKQIARVNIFPCIDSIYPDLRPLFLVSFFVVSNEYRICFEF